MRSTASGSSSEGRAVNKVIKSDTDYKAALAKIDALMDLDPDAGTTEGDELELLALLVSDYEGRTFPRAAVDPIAAMLFRMEQQNLTPRDLLPYIGSRSKVSEV